MGRYDDQMGVTVNITVVNGTEMKGCTYNIKETFMNILREGNKITEFYLPKDLPHFCCGCKTCFFHDEARCPHAEYVMPIWKSLLDADLLVFASPVYALRATAQMKSLLDHLCVHWMVHRPDEKMFHKKAVILTNAIGVFNGGAQNDIATSLMWLGIPHIKKLGIGLMEGVIWNELSEKRRNTIINKVATLARNYTKPCTVRRGTKTRLLFAVTKTMHQNLAKKEMPLSADNQYWLDKGWIKIE